MIAPPMHAPSTSSLPGGLTRHNSITPLHVHCTAHSLQCKTSGIAPKHDASLLPAGRSRCCATPPLSTPEATRCPFPYTLRLLGGRTPLCGIGVMSAIDVTVRPAGFNALNALSRPGPGPLINTSTSRMLNSLTAWRAAAEAASWAANGVLLRLPLNPAVPELAQHRTSPWGSVTVMIVLLNVART